MSKIIQPGTLPVSYFAARVRLLENLTVGLRADECWEWTGYRKNKYGFTEFSEQGIYAHRLSWLLHRGEIPEGMQVLHKCDNPPCVNPDHLFLGTNQDNVADMRAKRRAVDPPVKRGIENFKATLTDGQVAQIIAAHGVPQRKLARQFGASQSTIWRLRHGQTRVAS